MIAWKMGVWPYSLLCVWCGVCAKPKESKRTSVCQELSGVAALAKYERDAAKHLLLLLQIQQENVERSGWVGGGSRQTRECSREMQKRCLIRTY
jgi:hypothetical protein